MAQSTETHQARNLLQVDIVEFGSVLRKVSPVLRSASGEEFPVSDLCAYRDWGILEAHLHRGAGPRSSRLKELITRWRSRRDRRFVCWVARKPEAGSSWIYVIRPKVKYWADCFNPVIEEVLRSRPELGVLLVEEVRRGDHSKFGDVGLELPLDAPQQWKESWESENADVAETFLKTQLNDLFAIPDADLLASAIVSGWRLFSPILVRWLDVITAAFSRFPPAIVLVNNDLEMIRRSACLVAQRRSFPVVNLQHGMINRGQQYRLGVSDQHLLWGRFFEGFLTEMGADSTRLTVVGAPQYDSIVRGQKATNSQPEHPPRLLYAAQPASWEIPVDTCEHLVQRHFDLALTEPELQVSVRLHPREGPRIRKMVFDLSERQVNFNVDDSGSIWEAVDKCHAVSTVFSTVGLDAAVMRRPTLVLDFVGEARQMPMERTPPMFSVPTEQEFATAFEDVLKWRIGPSADDDWKRFSGEYLGGLDGHASSRAAAEIVQLVST